MARLKACYETFHPLEAQGMKLLFYQNSVPLMLGFVAKLLAKIATNSTFQHHHITTMMTLAAGLQTT
jgi:hypothetical protein